MRAWDEHHRWKHRGQRCGPWHLTLFHHCFFGMAQSSLFLLSWLFLIAGRRCLLSVRKFLCCLPVFRNDLVVTRGCFKLSNRSLGSTWDAVYSDKLLCYFDGETVSFPFPLLGKVLSVLGRQTSSCTAGGKTASANGPQQVPEGES